MDLFENQGSGLTSPGVHAAAITPSDSVDLTYTARGIAVGVAGTVQVTTVGGDTVTIYVAAGAVFPLRVNRIWATSTTATSIVAIW